LPIAFFPCFASSLTIYHSYARKRLLALLVIDKARNKRHGGKTTFFFPRAKQPIGEGKEASYRQRVSFLLLPLPIAREEAKKLTKKEGK